MRKLALAALLVAASGAAWFAYDVDAACCYFAAQEKDINQPGQKAFITWVPEENLESFTVQPKFEGNAVDFGMVIPTPSQPKLDEMPRDFFKDFAIYTILMPCPQPIWLVERVMLQKGGGRGGVDESMGPQGRTRDHGVKVLEAGVVGSLDYKIITAESPDGLYAWLKENGYVYSGDEATLGFYIEKKWFFTVMKIDPAQMKRNADGSYTGEVTPTRFTFTTEQCIYPLKITQISVKDKTDALLYVQAPQQMDLQGDLSWKHSFRVMWLTYMLGCGANEQQQTELATRQQWMNDKKAKDPAYETTKLEWARQLAEADLSILEDPLASYAQMGGADLPEGSQVIPIDQFLKEAEEELGKQDGDYAKERMPELRRDYTADKGQVVKVSTPGGRFSSSPYMWYANREAPADDVKGLSRLKGHLRQGQWITKIRKILRKDEMTDDLVLIPVDAGTEQEYVRLMPTSPP